MVKYISKKFIIDLISSSDIVKIISSEINLKLYGNKYKSYCPFHIENNPSFIVNKEQKFYYCFGCKVHGNVIDFLMNYYKINFIESVKKLAYINNTVILYENNFNYDLNLFKVSNNFFYEFMKDINKFYNNCLLFNEDSKLARNLLFSRGLDLEIINKFSLGYSSVFSINKFIYLYDKNKLDKLLNFGVLAKNSEGKIYDKLYGRITFPIWNLYGKIIGFGGRSVKENIISKYVNSSSNIFFSKKKCLYGLYNIKKKNLKKLLIVEGYLDVLTLNKFGIYYVVGLLGTNIYNDQIKILFKYTNNIIFCYDGDNVGIDSYKKIIMIISSYLSEKKKVYFMIIPKNYDPDTLIRKEGKFKFEDRINKSKHIFDFLFEYISLEYNLFTYCGKIKFANFVLNFISNINSNLLKVFLCQKLGDIVGITDFNQLSKLVVSNFNINNRINIKFKVLRYLIFLLLNNPYLSNLVNLSDNLFFGKVNISGLLLFLDIVNICIYNNNILFKNILNKYKKKNIKYYLNILFNWNYLNLNKNIELVFIDNLNRLKILIINKKLEKMILKEKKIGLNENEKIKIWNLLKLKNLKINSNFLIKNVN